MPVPVNHVGMSDIQTEYGGSSEISLTEYYRGDQYVPINQLKSIHTNKEIPLVSGGRTQEISIGMFRGTAKQFEWVFNITENRFTTFNLYNELVAVGWGENVPVKVTIVVFNGVYVVSQNTATPTMDFRGSFPASSEVILRNNGFILGRGGKGGYAGVYPNVPPTPGEDGGPAIHTAIFTTIQNNNTIAGGGGGGGATTASTFGKEYQQSETITTRLVRYNGRSGGGGAPFGAAGDVNPSVNGAFELYQVPGDYRGFGWGGIEEVGAIELHSAPSSASLTSPGAGSNSSFLDASYYVDLIGPYGGGIGSKGEHGHNYGGLSGSGSGFFVATNEGAPSAGGSAGRPVIISGSGAITWDNFGIVKGNLTGNVGTLRNSQNYNVLAYLTAHPQTETVQGHSASQIANPKISHVSSSPAINGAPGQSIINNPWVNTPNGRYSYDVKTNLTNIGANAELSPRGSPIYLIKYSTVVSSNSYDLAYLEGCVDDRISYVMINGQPVNLTYPNGQLNQSSIRATGSFPIPTNGPFVLSVGIIDDGGGTRNISGNMHMFSLVLKSARFGFQITSADQWIVDTVQNY